MDEHNSHGKSSLLKLPIGAMVPEQVAMYTKQHMRAKQTGHFSPNTVKEKEIKLLGKKVLSIDLGGDKLAFAVYQVTDDGLQLVADPEYFLTKFGEGYMDILEYIAGKAQQEKLPVGIAAKGTIVGTKLAEIPLIKIFEKEFKAKYDGDFGKLFPSLKAVYNDAVSGLIAGSVEAISVQEEVKNIMFVIVGSGMNIAVLSKGEIYTAEAGHVPVVETLNPFQQKKICDVFDADFTCVEYVASGKQGIEDIWLQKTGIALTGIEITEKLLQGDELATQLYDTSARLVAHMIIGAGEAYGFDEMRGHVVFIAHGGVFYVPGYGERLQQYLTTYLGRPQSMLFTKDVTKNVCLDGAAIAAAIA